MTRARKIAEGVAGGQRDLVGEPVDSRQRGGQRAGARVEYEGQRFAVHGEAQRRQRAAVRGVKGRARQQPRLGVRRQGDLGRGAVGLAAVGQHELVQPERAARRRLRAEGKPRDP